MRRFFLVLALTACAHGDIKQNAYIVGQSTKEVVDQLYGGWDTQANKRISKCVAKLPPAEHTVAEYDTCVGPFNETNQELAVNLLEGVRVAQLALFIALSENKSAAEVQIALAQVVAAVVKFRKFIEE